MFCSSSKSLFVIPAFRDSKSANIEIKALSEDSAKDRAESSASELAYADKKPCHNGLVHTHSKWLVPSSRLLIWLPVLMFLKSDQPNGAWRYV